MPDANFDPSDNSNIEVKEPPPAGDAKKAEKYINKLIELISDEKIEVWHTDLAKFDPSNLEDHYRIDLVDYQIEISHSKNPNSGEDSFVILFNNLKNLRDNNCEKVILAFMYLDQDQFNRFKTASFTQIEKKKKAAEEKRIDQVLKPIDEILDRMENNTVIKDSPNPEVDGENLKELEDKDINFNSGL